MKPCLEPPVPPLSLHWPIIMVADGGCRYLFIYRYGKHVAMSCA
jgi:hypothetical protein